MTTPDLTGRDRAPLFKSARTIARHRHAAYVVCGIVVAGLVIGVFVTRDHSSVTQGAPPPNPAVNKAAAAGSPIGYAGQQPPRARRVLTEAGVRFSFRVPRSWERFSTIPTKKSPKGPISLNKSSEGAQDAEAIIYWTSFPDGDHADPCARELAPSIGRSAAILADAVSTAPGTKLVKGPWNGTVGRYPAKRVVLTIRRNVGCNPGFFYTWREVFGGAFWRTTVVGDTIQVWIVPVRGTRFFKRTRLFIAAVTREDAGAMEWEVERIVGSFRFESVIVR